MRIAATRTALRNVVLLVTMAMLAIACGDKSDTISSQPVDTGPIDTIAPATTALLPTTTLPAPTTTAVPARVVAAWAIPAGIEVAVAGDDGLHLLTGSEDRIISPEVFSNVVADPSGGGWLVTSPVDFENAATPLPIRRIGNDGSDEVVLAPEAGTFLQLHDAGMVDGHATIFYNVNRQHEGATAETTDELFAFDVDTGVASKIADAGGWESGVDLKFGGGVLVGLLQAEARTVPWSYDLTGREEVIDMRPAGLAADYIDDPAGPQGLTISPDGTRLSWTQWNITDDGQYVSQQLVNATTDGASRKEFTLPAGPTRAQFLVDHGAYMVASSQQIGDIGTTPGGLIDAETGGMLVLPVAGPAAASGESSEPPRWPIPGTMTEDVTEEIKALEPQWVGGALPPHKALAEALLGEDTGDDECGPVSRGFPDIGLGDGPMYIELRTFCDDSVAGVLYEVFALGPMPDGSVTGSANRRVLCWRGVTADGLCV